MQIRIQIVRGTAQSRQPRRRVVLAFVAGAALAAAAPFAYSAVRNDIFTDVPSTAADHDAINRVYQAGIMSPCNTSPMQFCPNNNTLRRGIAKQYDYALGLSGTAGNFTPTFKNLNTPGYVRARGGFTQLPAGSGTIKAAAEVYCGSSGSVVGRSFVNMLGVSGAITIANGPSAGHCTLTFPSGTDIQHRFIQATASATTGAQGASYWTQGDEVFLLCSDRNGGINGWVDVTVF